MGNRLDISSKMPSGMKEYLECYGWHFSKALCDFAVSRMYKGSEQQKQAIKPYTHDDVKSLLDKYNIKLQNNQGYDCVFVANMAKADYVGSSITDDEHLAKFVKDYIDDPDGYDGLPMTRYYADCIGSGTVIIWEDML